MALDAAVAHGLARALVELAGLAALRADLVEELHHAVLANKVDGGPAPVRGGCYQSEPDVILALLDYY